ncbi:MAG: MFS transporter [Actinobacteria bacterium]|nr:MAG: MFS transporter [Actinomycetota bacterium]
MRAYVAGVGVAFAVGWNITIVGAVATDLSHSYGASLATIGLLVTVQFLVHMALQIPAGHAADRFGARRVALLALAIMAGANAVAMAAPSTTLAFVTRAFVGAGTALGLVPGSDYIRARGGSPFVQGIYGGASVLAPGIALAVVPQLVGPLGFRAPYASSVAVSLVALALMLAAADAPRTARHAGEHVDVGLFRDVRIYRFAAIHTASFGFSVVAGNWVVTLLQKHGHSHGASAAAGSLTLLLGFFTRPLGGWVLRHRPRAALPLTAASIVACGIGAIVLATPAPFPVLILASALVGLAAGIPFAVAFSGAAAARPAAPGAAVGFVNAWAALSILAGTPLVALTFSLPGKGRLGFLVLGIVWIALALATPRRSDLHVDVSQNRHEVGTDTAQNPR